MKKRKSPPGRPCFPGETVSDIDYFWNGIKWEIMPEGQTVTVTESNHHSYRKLEKW